MAAEDCIAPHMHGTHVITIAVADDGKTPIDADEADGLILRQTHYHAPEVPGVNHHGPVPGAPARNRNIEQTRRNDEFLRRAAKADDLCGREADRRFAAYPNMRRCGLEITPTHLNVATLRKHRRTVGSVDMHDCDDLRRSPAIDDRNVAHALEYMPIDAALAQDAKPPPAQPDALAMVAGRLDEITLIEHKRHAFARDTALLAAHDGMRGVVGHPRHLSPPFPDPVI